MILGITGPTGSGKTTLLNLIAQQGGLVLDCDTIYHRLLATDGEMLDAIERRFPGVIADGILDRKALGAIVFADPAALQDLNAITHTAVKKAVLAELAKDPKLAAIDAIGLFEGGLAPLCDVTVAVTAPEEQRIRRLMERDGITEEYARSRIAAQKPQEWFCSQCDRVLRNDADILSYSAKCLDFLKSLGIIYGSCVPHKE